MRVFRILGAIAAAVVLVSVVLAPVPVGPHHAPSADGLVVLVDSWVTNPAALVGSGAIVLENYGNGLVLMRLPHATTESVAGWLGVDPMPDRTLVDVYFSGTRFDTRQGEPEIPADLRAQNPDAWILQFLGPLRPEWVAQVEDLGLEVVHFLATYSAIARGPASAVQAAKALPFVGWTGPYHPAYKVPADLLEGTGDRFVSIMGFDGVSLGSLVSAVEALGATVDRSWGTPPTVLATLPSESVRAVAHLGDVISLGGYEDPVPMDRIAGQIHKYHSAWDSGRSGLPTTLTGRSPGPNGLMYDSDDFFEGAGIQDTGFDEEDPDDGPLDFFDSPNGDRVTRYLGHTPRSTTFPDGTCGSAHGTHVAGIIAADGYAWERDLIEDSGLPLDVTDKEWHQSEAGVAPEALVSMDGAQIGPGFGQCTTSGLATSAAYWDCQYLNGYITVPITVGVSAAVCGQPWIDGSNVATHNAAIDSGSRAYFAVASNSWGGGSGGSYGGSPFPAAIDSRTDVAPERLIIMAAGNDGPDLNTVGATALAKNGLTIGASQNFRPDQFESDNPNLMADFSSRGGPGQDGGRIKPDIVAIGTSVASLFGRGETLSPGYTQGVDEITTVDKYCANNPPTCVKTYWATGDGIADYRYLQGTSMATPHASGLALLVREYLREVVAGNNPASPYFNPPAHLVKAFLINGAVRMEPLLYDYPGYDQGWGRVDLEQSLFPPAPRTNQFELGQLTTTTTWTPSTMNLNVQSGDVPLKATLVWKDMAGATLARNLDLIVRSPGGLEYHGNQYTNGWSDPAKTGYDFINNVEQVEVEVPEPGVWTVQVRGFTIPNPADFAVVFSADVGPVAAYKVDLSTTHPTAVSISPGGSATIPFTVLNFGTNSDDIALSSTVPAGLSVQFWPANPIVGLGSTESTDSLAVINASTALPSGVYEFDLRAVSQNDTSAPPASDFLSVRVDVVGFQVPFALSVTNGTVDELDPSVLTFNDGTTSHIFIGYRKTAKVSANGRLGGVNVWVARTTLDAGGNPVLPFQHTEVTGLNEDPNDIRLLRLDAGTFLDRVIITWTGRDPDEPATSDAYSWSRVAFLDPPYTGSWTVRTIQKNQGTGAEPCKIARVSFPLFRAAPGLGPNGQLMYVWESLLETAGCTTLTNVHTYAKISTDGGNTWPAGITQVFPPPTVSNFYFFPNGYVDENDVAWVFAYWRTPTGNDRDLTVRLFDDAGWSTFPSPGYTILNTGDNIQWPAAFSTTESGGNRMYVVFTRDNLGADLEMNLMWTGGTYSSSVIPAQAAVPIPGCPGCTISPDFDTSGSGSGLLGPYGTSVSSANFNRRPILNIVGTTDGIIWLPYLENANDYATSNLHTYYSGDAYVTDAKTILTADAFAKGHQMSSTLGTSVYEVFHASRGTVTKVNYEVYLIRYFANWPTAADTLGPLVTGLGGTPNPVNNTASFRIAANLNDVTTGNSTIQGAEYRIDGGSWNPMNPIDIFDTPSEAAYADVDAGALLWGELECHTIEVRGSDSQGNIGPSSSYQQCTTGTPNLPPAPPSLQRAVLAGAGLDDVEITFGASVDEWAPSGTIKYRVYRDTNMDNVFVQLTEIPATNASSYVYTDVGVAADADTNNYRYYVTSIDDRDAESPTVQRAAKFTRALSGFGWHLVSVPVVQTDPSVTATFRTLTWSRARMFDATDPADPWKSHIVARPYKEFTTVSELMGIWVYIDVPSDRLTVAGLIPSGASITMQPGWNLIGFPRLKAASYTVGALRAAVGPTVLTRVEGFDPLGPYYLQNLPDATVLQPGFGYWVYIRGVSPVTWNVP